MPCGRVSGDEIGNNEQTYQKIWRYIDENPINGARINITDLEGSELNSIGTKTIETERLILRKFEITDAQNMFDNWANDCEVCKFLSWEPHGNIDVTKNLLASWIESYQNNDIYNWVMVLKQTNEAIGSLSVINISAKHNNCELGYCMSKSFWNQGLMTEAVKSVINFLFKEVGIHRIQARHDTLNPGSGRVMEKSGMAFEGTARHGILRKNCSYADHNIWAIINEN